MERRGKDLPKLKEVMTLLIEEKPLPEKLRDHNLVGNYTGCRDCHIEPDWLLIYTLSEDKTHVTFERTGSHADLFS
jgi:mRNA interferase YafQ